MDTRAVPPRETIALTACALHAVCAAMALLLSTAVCVLLPACLACLPCLVRVQDGAGAGEAVHGPAGRGHRRPRAGAGLVRAAAAAASPEPVVMKRTSRVVLD